MIIIDFINEYFNYFLDGISFVLNFIFINFPIVAGVALFILGINMYLNQIAKDPINYNSKKAIQEIRSRSVSWEWLIFVIILGACLIIMNV